MGPRRVEFGTCCKALKGERIACKGEAGEGITKNF